MAKINTFFIRASAQATALSSFDQVEIDLGSFVDALGQSILRIHRVDVSIRDSLVPQRTMMCAIGGSGSITWQLTTQTKTAPVFATDKSVISMGALNYYNASGAVNEPTWMNDSADIMPQNFESGYLIGTEQIYLGVQDGSGDLHTDATLSVVLECSVSKLTKESALALALSQQ